MLTTTLFVVLGWCLLSIVAGLGLAITIGHLQAANDVRPALVPTPGAPARPA
jgi:hypothetical protein